jgi:hypothetical protein
VTGTSIPHDVEAPLGNGHEAPPIDPRTFFTRGFPDPGRIADDIAGPGYAIYHDALALAPLQEMKAFWLAYFEASRPRRGAVRGMFRLGEPNFNSYTDSRRWCLYRDFDFLWNAPTHALTREFNLALHKKRNQAQGFPEDDGLVFSPGCYGVYVSTSYYPPARGHLREHADGHRGVPKPILHFMVPITFEGIDYADGGLFIMDRRGQKVDVDARLNPGSVVFYDGRRDHGVDPIVPLPGRAVGRIGTFAIPTFFKTQDELPAPLRLLESFYLRVQRRLAPRPSWSRTPSPVTDASN